jgi:hypothetical protein
MSVLVPILDLLNHRPGAPTTLTLDGDDVIVRVNSDGDAAAGDPAGDGDEKGGDDATTTTTIPRGAEVCIDYGKGLQLSRFQLLHTFGFVPWQSMTHDGDRVSFSLTQHFAAPSRYSAAAVEMVKECFHLRRDGEVRLVRGQVGRRMSDLRLFRHAALAFKGKLDSSNSRTTLDYAALGRPQSRGVEMLAVHLARDTIASFIASKTTTLEADCAELTSLRSRLKGSGSNEDSEDDGDDDVSLERHQLAVAYRIGVHLVAAEHVRFLSLVLGVVKAAFAGGGAKGKKKTKKKVPSLTPEQLVAAIDEAALSQAGADSVLGGVASTEEKAEAVAYIAMWVA